LRRLRRLRGLRRLRSGDIDASVVTVVVNLRRSHETHLRLSVAARSTWSRGDASRLPTADALGSRCGEASVLDTGLELLCEVIVRLLVLGSLPAHLVLHALGLAMTNSGALYADTVSLETTAAVGTRENEEDHEKANVVVVEEVRAEVADVAGKAAHGFELFGAVAVDEALSHGVGAHHIPTDMVLEDIGDRGDRDRVDVGTVDPTRSRRRDSTSDVDDLDLIIRSTVNLEILGGLPVLPTFLEKSLGLDTSLARSLDRLTWGSEAVLLGKFDGVFVHLELGKLALNIRGANPVLRPGLFGEDLVEDLGESAELDVLISHHAPAEEHLIGLLEGGLDEDLAIPLSELAAGGVVLPVLDIVKRQRLGHDDSCE
jgi:hypothetical protein